jgi:hypothetical protein
VQIRGFEVHLPAQIADLGGPETVAKGQQDHQCIAMTVSFIGGRLDKPNANCSIDSRRPARALGSARMCELARAVEWVIWIGRGRCRCDNRVMSQGYSIAGFAGEIGVGRSTVFSWLDRRAFCTVR